MASVLNVFEPKTKILSAKVNENFELVQTDINEMGQALNSYVEAEITSMQSNVSSVQATLQENINGVSNKLSSIYDNIAPNYKAGYSISSGWTAPKAGWLYPYHYNTHDNQELVVTIDGVEVFRTGDAGTWSTGHGASSFIFVRKGKKVEFSGSGTNNVKFFPCVGN